jgi:hypothetical protein
MNPNGTIVTQVELQSNPLRFTAPGLDLGFSHGSIIDSQPVFFR